MRRQSQGKGAYQLLVSIRIDTNLLAGEGKCKSGSMGSQFAAGLLCGSSDFLLGSPHHFANILFGSLPNANFLGCAFLFRSGLHLSDFDV